MADNVAITAGSGTTVATDDVGAGVQVQRVKPVWGVDGSAVDTSASNPLPTVQTGALPAGTNNIGDVDILSIAAGDNNIGNVDVVTLPALAAGTNNIGDVDVLSVVPGTGATALGKAIDSAVGATDTGIAVLAVRDDALSTLTPVESDYVPLRVNSTGALHVTGGGSGTEYTEDAAAAADPVGNAIIMVRKDTPAATVSADGDNIALRGNDFGAAYVQVIDAVGGAIEGVEQYTEDAAAASDPVGDVLILIRDDALSGQTSADGDNVAARGTDKGEIYVKHADSIAITAASLPSHAVTNAGTFVTQVDGAALTALQLIDNPVVADDATFTPGTTSVMMAGFEADEGSTDSVDEGDGGAARMTLDRKVITTPQPHTIGGLSNFHLVSAGSTNATVVKASAGQLYGWYIYNSNAAARKVAFHNSASTPTAGTSVVMTLVIPPLAGANLSGTHGIVFSAGIAITTVTELADNGTTGVASADLVIELFYK